MTPQVLAVKARLMQDDPRVSEVASLCSTGTPWHKQEGSVKRITAALIYVACGCRITRCRKVVNVARMALRGHRRDTPSHAARYEAALLDNALTLAKHTTPARQRKPPKRPSP